MQNKTFDAIKENKLFAWIDPSHISKIKIDQKKFLSYKEGCVIYRINDESSYVFLVIEGEVKLKNYAYVPRGGEQTALKIKNDFFGEREIIYKSPRTSAAFANRDCLLYALSINDLPKNLIRKLYFLNNAAIPDQEYFPKDKIPRPVDSEKIDIQGTGKSRFLRVDPPGRMIYYRELHKMPFNRNIFNNVRFALPENDIELQENKTLKGDDIQIPERPALSFFIDEYEKENKINSVSLSVPDVVFSSWTKKTAGLFFKIGLSGDPLGSLLTGSADLLQCQKCDLYIADILSNELIRLDPLKKSQVKFKIGLALTGTAAERKEILFSNDVRCDPKFIPEFEGIEGMEINSMLCLPLLDNENNLLAVLRFINKLDREFSIEDKKFLDLFSPFFSSFIEKQTASGKLKKTARDASIRQIKDDLRENFHLIKTSGNALIKMGLGSEVNDILEMLNAHADFGIEILSFPEDFSDGSFLLDLRNEDITGILEYSLKTLAGYAESKNVKLLKKFAAEAIVRADKMKFRLACFHIIKYLCRTMPGGGKIYIKSENEEGRIKVEFKSSPNLLRQLPNNIPESKGSAENAADHELSITGIIVSSFGGTLQIKNSGLIISFPLNASPAPADGLTK